MTRRVVRGHSRAAIDAHVAVRRDRLLAAHDALARLSRDEQRAVRAALQRRDIAPIEEHVDAYRAALDGAVAAASRRARK